MDVHSRARRRTSLAATVAAVLAGALLAPGAFAADTVTNAVITDYAGDGDITTCAFTQAQLEHVVSQITPDIDAYAPDLRDELDAEIGRWTNGGCSGLPGGGGPGGGTPGGQPGGNPGGHTGGGQNGAQLFTFRATISSLKVAKNRKSVKVKLRCPATAAPACGVLLSNKLAGKSAAKTQLLAVMPGQTKTVTVKLKKAASNRLSSKGGKLKFSALTVGSALASTTKTAKVAAPKS